MGHYVRKLVVINSVTIDGVMQAPGRRDEDRRGGFKAGGWAVPYADSVMAAAMSEHIGQSDAMLLGRRTYEDFASVWPNMSADNPYTAVINNTRKYVASRTLKEPLAWNNSVLLSGDAVKAVAKLKKQPGKDLVVLGSGELIQSLMPAGLVDEFVLLVHPLILGQGIHLFPDGGASEYLKLTDVRATTTGVLIATYEPTEPLAA